MDVIREQGEASMDVQPSLVPECPSSHPNVHVRGFPLTLGEAEIAMLFGQFGEISSLRLARHPATKQVLG